MVLNREGGVLGRGWGASAEDSAAKSRVGKQSFGVQRTPAQQPASLSLTGPAQELKSRPREPWPSGGASVSTLWG